MSGWHDHILPDLLAEHGLYGLAERDFPNDGWSGSTFTSIESGDGRRFVLKRTSLERDWIARATLDDELREGWVASGLSWLPRTAVPYLGAASDGDAVAILTPDLSTELIAWERPDHDPAIDEETLGTVLRAIARLHAVPWGRIEESARERHGQPPPPWCPLRERLLLLSPLQAARYTDEGNPVGERFLFGWAAFDRLAPSPARKLIHDLAADPGPLLSALGRLPSVGLHGDLKLANVALLPDEDVAFIDWQMTLRAPVAVEIGWFLVSNSAALPLSPEPILAAYRHELEWDSGRWGFGSEPHDFAGLAGDWDLQVDLAWIIGLLLRGWRKGLDAEAGVVLPTGVTAAADLAWWSERAVEAAERRL